MSRLRHVPPVHSPLPPRALWAGLRSARRPEIARRERAAVLAELSRRTAGADVVLTDSGTSALILALTIASRGTRRPVALPAFGCFDLATAVRGADLPYVLYDVDPATLAPDEASLRRALAVEPGSVVVAHLFGHPVDTDRVVALAHGADALVIDDAAQGVGATLNGRSLGIGGALGVMSFGRGKGLTGGGGGALIVPATSEVRDAALALTLPEDPGAPWLPLLKGFAQWALARPALYGVPASMPFLGLGETPFREPHEARAMHDFSAGVLARTLPLADGEFETRRENARRLRHAIEGSALLVPQPPPSAEPGHLRLPVVVPADRVAFAHSRASRQLGIMPTYPVSLADLAGFGGQRLLADAPLDGARQLVQRLVTLPTHSGLSRADLAALERWIRDAR